MRIAPQFGFDRAPEVKERSPAIAEVSGHASAIPQTVVVGELRRIRVHLPEGCLFRFLYRLPDHFCPFLFRRWDSRKVAIERMLSQDAWDCQSSPVGTAIDSSFPRVGHEAFEDLGYETSALHCQYPMEESQAAQVSFILLTEDAQLRTLHCIRRRVLGTKDRLSHQSENLFNFVGPIRRRIPDFGTIRRH